MRPKPAHTHNALRWFIAAGVICVAGILIALFCIDRSLIRGHAEVKEKNIIPTGDTSDTLAEEIRAKVDSVMVQMSVEAKAAQLVMPAVFAADDPYTLRRVTEYGDEGIGGLVLLKGDAVAAATIADTLFAVETVPPFIAIDAEWGLSMRLVDAPSFPANGKLNPKVSDQLMYDYGRELARECRRIGINMVLGPVMDVSGSGGIMGIRSLGDDPRRVADLAVAYSRGIEGGGVISVAKHFPGHGSVSADSHRVAPVIERSYHALDSIDLYPFREYIASGLSGIMVGHLVVVSIDSEKIPAAVSRGVITDLLRDDMEFRGLVLTDAMNMGGAAGYGAADALRAGADIIVAPENTNKAIGQIKEMARDSIGMTILDARVRNVLFYKYLFGMDEHGGINYTNLYDDLNTPQARQLADSLRKR